MSTPRPTSLRARIIRVRALVQKETWQLMRDPSSLAIGIVMPLILILLFGYALSLDVTSVPVALVLEAPSPESTELAASFVLSPYFDTHILTSMPRAAELLQNQTVDGIIRLRSDFARRLNNSDAGVEIVVNGTDANQARIIETYAAGSIAHYLANRSSEGRGGAQAGQATVEGRLWFNEADDSHYFLVPGLTVLIMTLIGALMTALVMAREWERGTLEAIFVTPVRTGEILIAKMIPYFGLGMIGLAFCLLSARFLFGVPFLGSITVLTIVSMLYLLVALAVGLLISSLTKNQFVSSMVTLVVTFLPAVFLSGFLFDLRSMPTAVRILSYALPARYYTELLQTIFLAGNIWAVILPNAAVLAAMAAVLLALARVATKKRIA